MKRARAAAVTAVLSLAFLSGAGACGDGGAGGAGDEGVPVPGRAGATKTSAAARAVRRAFDGAPPVTPHGTSGGFTGECASCHTPRGLAVEGLGFAPPSPHGATPGMGAARCQQCHVERVTDELFRPTAFEGLAQDLREGPRQHPAAPPVMPHARFMREDCAACHAGSAAREELRCSHPERVNCTQCHLEQRVRTAFAR